MQEYKSCFSKGYWKSAFGELKNVKSIAVCALFVALRIAVKSLRIYIIPGVLQIGFDFIVNSLGSMIYGPILALLGGLISDTVGAFVFPSGTYFFPYALIEMSSGFIFALFLYRSKLTGPRIILSRFTVVVLCNLIFTPIVNYWFGVFTDNVKAINLLSQARIIKNVCLLPVESLILILFLGALILPLARMGLIPSCNQKGNLAIRLGKNKTNTQTQQLSVSINENKKLTVTCNKPFCATVEANQTGNTVLKIEMQSRKTNKTALLLIALTLLSVVALVLYYLYKTKG